MYDQIENSGVDSFAHSVKLFMLGMLLAFTISFLISIIPAANSLAKTTSVDCENKAAFVAAQDRSRNGIANGCPIIFNNNLKTNGI